MRTLDRTEASSVHSKSKKKKRISLISKSGTPNSIEAMDPADGIEKGGQQQQQQRSYLSHQQQQQSPQESRQPQHRGLYQQQPPPPAYAQPPPAAQTGTSTYPRGNPYAQQQPVQDITMASSQTTEHEYLQQPQQYMHHQGGQYAAGGYPSGAARQYAAQQQQALSYQQQMTMQHQYAGSSSSSVGMFPSIDATAHQSMQPHHPGGHPQHANPTLQQPYLQPKVGRLPADRPLIKLSVSLIDTYKEINTIYYEERDARRATRAKEKAKSKSSQEQQQPSGGGGSGANNNGWDDEHYDYIITPGELFYGRYRMKERIGKGSFGQVVRAEDTQENREVAIKIIKSKKPFLLQAKTEIELLTHLNDKDPDDQNNIVRLITHFMYRNHQCLVFEMLSLNLYELLKNTQFGGVSLNLIRKFAKQVLKSLSFLARNDVDVIHCDLKPENILLRHPKKSGIKVIDFGSSCRSKQRMYSYIQSRFYRSPEVMLGLPYAVSIDVWSLGCILAEMHTGEPLFSGSDQFEQMQKIVKLLGMIPSNMLDQANDQHRLQFFERSRSNATGREEWSIKQHNTSSSSRGAGSSSKTSSPAENKQPEEGIVVVPSTDPISSLTEVIRAETSRKKKYPPSETGNSLRNYELFVALIHRMLSYDPRQRITPAEALNHPFITEQIK